MIARFYWFVITFLVPSMALSQRWLLGTGATYCNYINSPGINVNLTYRVWNQLHVGPDFSALLTREVEENGKTLKRKELEYNFNGQYLFEIAKSVAIYPLAGINLSKITMHPQDQRPNKRTVVGMNLGVGAELELKDLKLFIEAKHVNQLSKTDVTAGVVFVLDRGSNSE